MQKISQKTSKKCVSHPFLKFLTSFIAFQAIGRYFNASLSKASSAGGGDPKPVKIKQVYAIRDVIKQKYRELIEDKIPFKPTDKNYLSCYQAALTQVQNEMSDEDLGALQKIVDSWNEQGAPSEVKLKQVFNFFGLLFFL